MTGADKKNRYKHNAGYILIHMPGHHRAKANRYALEHIIIMENHLGRKIFLGECVHHKNGIKDDNRIENLEVMSVGDHVRLHHKHKEICIIKDCGMFAEGLGLCNKHYIGHKRNYKKYREIFKNYNIGV